MKKLADFLVEKRLWFFISGMIFAAICLVLMFFVNINYDLTEYLADDSDMREGLDIMKEEYNYSVFMINIHTKCMTFLHQENNIREYKLYILFLMEFLHIQLDI